MKVLLLATNIDYFGNSGGSLHLRELVSELKQLCELHVVCGYKILCKDQTVHFYNTNAGTFSLRDFLKILKLAKSVDVLYSRIDPCELSGVLVAKLLKKPIYGEVNTNFLSYEKKSTYRDLFYPLIQAGKLIWVKFILSQLDAVICVSETIRSSLVRKLPNSTMFVVRNGGNPKYLLALDGASKQNLRKKLGLPMDKVLVIFSGELGPRHGLDLLLGLKLPPEFKILVCGGTSKYKHYLEKIKQKKLPHLIFISNELFKGNEEKYFAASDIGIAPYKESYNKEPFGFCPLKILQMMSSALPVVASDRPWVREILSDSEGIITNNFESGLLRLRDRQLRLKKGLIARQKIINELSWSHSAKKIYDICKDLCRRYSSVDHVNCS